MISKSLIPSYLLNPQPQPQAPAPLQSDLASWPNLDQLNEQPTLPADFPSAAATSVTASVEVMDSIAERTEEFFSSFDMSVVERGLDHNAATTVAAVDTAARSSPGKDPEQENHKVEEMSFEESETRKREEMSQASEVAQSIALYCGDREVTAENKAKGAAPEEQESYTDPSDSVSAMLPPLPPTHHLQPNSSKRRSLPHVFGGRPRAHELNPLIKKSGIPSNVSNTKTGEWGHTRRASVGNYAGMVRSQQEQPNPTGMSHRRSSSTQSIFSSSTSSALEVTVLPGNESGAPVPNSITGPNSSGPGSNGSLLALPLASQLHTLKARNAQLESSLSSLNKIDSSDLFRAKQRILNLEEKVKELEPFKIEAEGWESEAKGLMSELEKVTEELQQVKRSKEMETCEDANEGKEDPESELRTELRKVEDLWTGEKEKKRRYKEIGARLRAELIGRRWKEKWELGIMDGEDRQRDIAMVGLEYDLAIAEMNLGFEQVRTQEVEEVVDQQRTKVSELTASRSILLDSFNEAQETIIGLRESISSLQKDSSTLSRTKLDLKKYESSIRSSNDQVQRLKVEKEDLESVIERLEIEIESVRTEVDSLRDGRRGDKSEQRGKESKVIESLKKALEKEREKREQAEEEFSRYKSSFEQAQMDTLEAQVSATKPIPFAQRMATAVGVASKGKNLASTASMTKAVAAEMHSHSVEASVPKHAVEKVSNAREHSYEVEEEEIPGEPDSEEGEIATPVRIPTKTFTRLEKSQKKEAATKIRHLSPAFSASEEDEEEEVYKPAKSKSRSKPLPSKRKRVSDEGDESYNYVVAPKKKPDKRMLADKSTNKIAAAPAKPSNIVGAGKKKAETSVDVDDDLTVAAEEPLKKKKRKLFGGPKKFEWGSIENLDVNSLGLPSKLSPIKGVSSAPLTTFGVLGNARKNIFG